MNSEKHYVTVSSCLLLPRLPSLLCDYTSFDRQMNHYVFLHCLLQNCDHKCSRSLHNARSMCSKFTPHFSYSHMHVGKHAGTLPRANSESFFHSFSLSLSPPRQEPSPLTITAADTHICIDRHTRACLYMEDITDPFKLTCQTY